MTESEQFPRVVVLCDEPINKVSGGGVTMGNLFRGWPKDRLGQVFAHHRFEIDTDVCSHYLRLGEHKMPGDGWVPEWLRRPRKLVKRMRSLIRPGVRLDYERVLTWAKDFRPDVIYSQATPYPMYTWWLPRRLSEDLNIPLVNHIMDDWPAAMEREWLPGYKQAMRPIMHRQLRATFDAGVCNLAISQEMADAFAGRYETFFTPFHNVIDVAEWDAPKQDYAVQGETFRVVYLGALADNNQVHSLRDVALAIASLAERGAAVSLTVYTGEIYLGHYEQYLDGLTAVSHGGRVGREDLCATLAAADLLVVPVNFDAQSLAMIQYSMPTKVPEYMASGAPVLVYAPAHVPAAAYARRAGWGYVVDRQDRAALEHALKTLITSKEMRAELGQRGRELALRHHDAQVVRTQFQALLHDVAVGTKPKSPA
jgi:glycosyltransferase involved in cell wall biosynthesis